MRDVIVCLMPVMIVLLIGIFANLTQLKDLFVSVIREIKAK